MTERTVPLQDDPPAGRLERVLRNAACRTDARGDEVRVLATGPARHCGERLPQPAVRTGDDGAAASAAIRDLDLDPGARSEHAAVPAATEELRHGWETNR